MKSRTRREPQAQMAEKVREQRLAAEVNKELDQGVPDLQNDGIDANPRDSIEFEVNVW